MIGFLDLDGKMPIIPLMKIKNKYKDQAEWFNPMFKYEKVYVSKAYLISHPISSIRSMQRKL